MNKAERSKLHYDKCHQMATSSIRGGNIANMLELNGLQLKAGKTNADVQSALQKGAMRGKGRLENELMEIAMAFQRVIELKKEA